MAKAKKFDNGMEWEITPKTKNTTWIYDGNGEKSNYTLKVVLSDKDKETYSELARNLTTRKGYDLVVTTIFEDKKKLTTKMVTTTIKNFYTTLAVSESTIKIGNIANFNYTVEGKNGLFAEIEETEEKDYILGSSAKKADLALTLGGKDVVVDIKGNDNYSLSHQYSDNNSFDTIFDYAGNDTYNTKNNNFTRVTDTKGNDKYTTEEDGRFNITEYSGKDIYNLSGSFASTIEDYKGNDKYNVKDTTPSEAGIGQDITDYAGKDVYTIENSRGVYIEDSKGNDKYIAKNINKSEQPFVNFMITDDSGNDKYEFTNVHHKSNIMLTNNVVLDASGKNKYTVNDSEGVYINDEAGADKYTFKQTTAEATLSNIEVSDIMGKDTYTVSGFGDRHYAESVKITDKGNDKDKYTLTNAFSFKIKDEGTTSKDTYNIKNCMTSSITDAGGNDTYNFTGNNNVSIDDKGGEKDVLNLKGVKKSNIIFMTDIMSTKTYSGENELILFDTDTSKFIEIDNFFSNTDDTYNGFGTGRIETLKLGGKKVKQADLEVAYQNFNEIKSDVATWIAAQGRADVLDILTVGTEEQVTALVQMFTGGNV